jgi:thiamine biosynthesis lipoprotein
MTHPEFHHEAMATTFGIVIAGHDREYARPAAAAAFRELDRLENELSRYIESSDIGRANRLAAGETIRIGEDTLQCLLLAADVSIATHRAFDAAYASKRAPDQPADAPAFALDPQNYTLTSRVARLHLDLGAIGKGYALDRMAALLAEWSITTACLHGGGSTALALEPPPGETGWPVGLGEGGTHRLLSLRGQALSGSGIAVKGAHLVDPRTGSASGRTARAWCLAPTAALSDALSTAFFILPEIEIAAFCVHHPEFGAASAVSGTKVVAYGALEGLI